jgi:hypothetical protein
LRRCPPDLHTALDIFRPSRELEAVAKSVAEANEIRHELRMVGRGRCHRLLAELDRPV